MNTRSIIGWAGIFSLGLIWIPAEPVMARDVVQYRPGNPFQLDQRSGNNTQILGTLHIESDSTSGWTLRVQSENEGRLSHVTTQVSIPYSLRVSGDTVNNLSSGQSVTVRTTSRSTCAPPEGCDYQVEASVSATSADDKPSGSYSDRLIFTLVSP